MKYIESLREGERINEVYLCKFKQAALTKAGKPYDNVILQDNQISRQHCSIVYDVFRKTYIVRDFSSNGTFLEDGSRLKPNQINELPPGTKIRVGDNSTFVLK